MKWHLIMKSIQNLQNETYNKSFLFEKCLKLKVLVGEQKWLWHGQKGVQVEEGKIFRGTRLKQVIDVDTSTPASHADDQHLKENTCWSFLQGYHRQSLIKCLERLLIRTWSCHSNNPSRQSTFCLTSDEGIFSYCNTAHIVECSMLGNKSAMEKMHHSQ